jgi:hypothetical protein
MTSRVCALIAGVMLLFRVAPAGAADDPQLAFVSRQFEAPLPEKQRWAVIGDTADDLKKLLGHRYAYRSIPYWHRAGVSVWILSTHGKHGLITTGFAMADGRITICDVIEHREIRGRPITTGRYLKQFSGLGLNAKGRLDGRIDGITGATISSTAMKQMAHAALHLDAQRAGDK